jgi:hypothetical protein
MAGAPIPTVHMTISPQGWGLKPAGNRDAPLLADLGLDKEDLEERARSNTYNWLPNHFDESIGAFHGYYDARSGDWTEPQTVNLIAPFQCLAAFDRFRDERFLQMARRAADWLHHEMVETHPMSLVLGGVRDNIKTTQLWTKYTADYVTLNLGLWERLAEEEYLARAEQSSRFLLQSQNHRFAPKYDHWQENWIPRGWQSFGRVIVAMIALQEFTHRPQWLQRAVAWADYGLRLQADNGCFHLINNNYYSSDIAADEIRGLIRVYLRTDDRRFLDGALRFADWHLARQDARGTWPLSEDRWGVPVTDYKGPGDMPNIAIALLLAHMCTGESKYVDGAVKALRYTLTQQQLPDGEGPYVDDSNTHWGFWSWDPPYDYTMSADQSTHHCRGYWFFIDYVLSLKREQVSRLREDLLSDEKAAAG